MLLRKDQRTLQSPQAAQILQLDPSSLKRASRATATQNHHRHLMLQMSLIELEVSAKFLYRSYYRLPIISLLKSITHSLSTRLQQKANRNGGQFLIAFWGQTQTRKTA